MTYEKTGNPKSRKKDIERTAIKQMSSSTIIFESGRELYSRYSTEIFATLLFTSWAMYIYAKLG